MARRQHLPSYRLHKPSGQAVVTIKGKDHYLGGFETPESRDRYGALISELLTSGRPVEKRAAGATVDHMIAAYWDFVERSGRYQRDGVPTSEREWLQNSLRPLSTLFGASRAEEFGPKKLQALRAWMLEVANQAGKKLSRTTVNGRIRRVVHVFRWAASMELVPASVWHGLQSVPGLRRDETTLVKEPDPVRPVPYNSIQAVLQHVGRVVGVMIQLQWLTGMRPGEVCSMRMGDVDRSGDVWVYRPREHKTQHHDLSCERLLGPRAQALLQPLLRPDPDTLVFSPEQAECERNRFASASIVSCARSDR